MALGKVKISLANGAVGSLISTGDNISAIVMNAASAPSGLALGTPKAIYNLQEAVALGITLALFPRQYRAIKEFYDGFDFASGSESCELWIMLVANTMTFTQMLDNTNASGAKKLLDAAGGRVRLLAVVREPAGGYTPTLSNGIDQDVVTAASNGQTLATAYANNQQPFRILIEGFNIVAASIGSLPDLRSLTNNRVGVVIWSSVTGTSASVSMTLGIAAGLPVQRNIGRIKNGALPLTAQPFIGTATVESLVGSWDAIHDKGYIFLRNLTGKSGYFLNDDPMAAAASDDYAQLGRGRVIDKLHRLAYDVLSNELNDDVDTVDGGKPHPAVIATINALVERRVKTAMSGELSTNDDGTVAFKSFIDPNQNLLNTNKLVMVLRARPKGYLKDIDVSLGFALTI